MDDDMPAIGAAVDGSLFRFIVLKKAKRRAGADDDFGIFTHCLSPCYE